jgi:hypothetical protein
MPTRSKKKVRTLIPAAVIGSLAVVSIAACGSSSGGSAATNPESNPQPGASVPAAVPGGGQRPAASGLIAAVDANTMQVQNQQSGQVAVSWTDSTKFSHTVTVKASSIKAGDCVTAIAPSGTDQSATSFTATTVSVTDSTSGECGRGGVGGGFGGPGGGAGRPSGLPSNLPSGGPGGAGNFGGIATGKVVSVSGSSLVIDAQSFNPSGGSSAPSTVKKTVTVGSGTKMTGQASTTASSVAVGKCATVQGTAGDSGAVTATSVSITDADNGQCTGGFPGFGGGNGNG